MYAVKHRHAEELLDKTIARLAAVRCGVLPMALIALLDQEKTLKHLLEHHYEREDRALFRLACDTLPDSVWAELSRTLHP
ncbi:MAG: hypothetical protein ACRESA_05790 [Gammaproteobacteria bacterium]